ncbi:MAG: coiled-coil protein [Promethearchaeota archaeon]
MIEELTKKLDGLKKKASWLKQLRDESNTSTKEYLKERNELNSRHSELISRAKSEQKLRNEMNKRVAEHKESKERLRKEILELVKEVKQFREQKQGITPPHRPPRKLARQIEKIEWKIQTTVLDVKKERELIKTVSELEKDLEEQKKHTNINSRIIETQTKIETLKSNVLLHNKEIAESADVAQEHHTNMINLYDDAKQVKERADLVHKRFLEAKELANDYHQKYLEIRNQMRTVVQKIHEQKSIQRKERFLHEEELIKEKTKKAYEKLKEGEKLTFDEFSMLLEQGLI